MPNKLTDAEVKKALEHCADVNSICETCILFNPKDDDCKCSRVLKRNALDLINRQTIRLRKVEHQLDDALKMYNTIKAEAYKEAFEKLKEKKRTMLDYDEAGFSSKITVVSIEKIDNLLNELVGDKK
jgi:hypothetical protein